MGNYTKEQLASRIVNIRGVENVMSKFAFLTYYKRFDEAFRNFWCQSDKIPTLTTNDKRYAGYQSIYNYYVEQGEEETRAGNQIIRSLYPDEFAQKKDSEMWGAGTAVVHTITTPVIELAEDEKTCKAMFYSVGAVTEVEEAGPKAYWMWEKYAVDFIKEDGQWKIWHLVIMTDFKTPVGSNWAKVNVAPTGEFYESYTPRTTPQEGVPVPVPYSTFAETFSY